MRNRLRNNNVLLSIQYNKVNDNLNLRTAIEIIQIYGLSFSKIM